MKSMLWLFCVVLTLVSGQVNAQDCGCIPLLYEGFDYAAGENMHQKAGGTGWNGEWNSQSGDTQVGFRVGSATLAFSNLRSNFRSFVGGHFWQRIGRTLDLNPTGPFVDYIKPNGLLGKDGTTLWMSSVFQKTLDNNEQSWFALHNTNVNWYEGNPGTSNSRLMVGYFGADHSTINGIRYWTVRIGDNYYPTSVPIDLAMPAFFAIKLVFNANSTAISLYINPAQLGSANTPPAVPSWSFTTTTPLEFHHFSVYGEYNIDNFALDEIRFSSNYACVAPESTMAENLLPTASMTVSALSGVAPLSVSLNGTASSDPDGTLEAGMGTTFSLTHENGFDYPYTGSSFSNLPVGNCTLTVAGLNNCTDTFHLYMPADSMNCANISASGSNALVFGMNIEGIAYWGV